MMNRALVIEDDDEMRDLLTQVLGESGFEITPVADGESGLKAASDEQFDIILLDVMLPQRNGFEVCRTLREQNILTPVLILTALDSVDDKIKGLDAGADDYLGKPFVVPELLARSRALLRRASYNSGAVRLRVGDLELDPFTRRATRKGQQIRFSATEYTLLELLMKNAGRVMSRKDLMEGVWNYDFGGQDNVLEVYISYLRRKIDRPFDTPLLKTIRGIGYSLIDPTAV
ncbi:response regulator MprA [Abditibacteriota bacterium]|nr:response regulator MprA [Abditibacteriota bacterium]